MATGPRTRSDPSYQSEAGVLIASIAHVVANTRKASSRAAPRRIDAATYPQAASAAAKERRPMTAAHRLRRRHRRQRGPEHELNADCGDVTGDGGDDSDEPGAAPHRGPQQGWHGRGELPPVPAGDADVRSRLQPQPALLEQVSEQGFRLRGRHQPLEDPLREGERRWTHARFHRRLRPSDMFLSAFCDALSARCPAASISKCRFARPPRSAVGSPVKELT